MCNAAHREEQLSEQTKGFRQFKNAVLCGREWFVLLLSSDFILFFYFEGLHAQKAVKHKEKGARKLQQSSLFI